MNTCKYLLHYFSPVLLLSTLLSPYKRLIVVESGPGFDVQKKFQNLSFNLVSRGVGAFVRMSLLFVGLFLVLIALVGGLAGLLFWLLFPPLSLSVYAKHIRQPQWVVSKIIEKINTGFNPLDAIFDNDAGLFFLSHIGRTKKDLTEKAKFQTISFTNVRLNSYEELITYLLDNGVWVREDLYPFGLTVDDVKNTAKWWDKRRYAETELNQEHYSSTGIALNLTFGYTPTLNQYVTDLSTPQSFVHHLIGRQQIVNRIERELTSGQNVFLTGDPGVGRKTVILEFAHRAVTGQLGSQMAYKRILEFDYNALLAKSMDLNKKKVELNQILTEAAYAGNIILMIRDLHRLVNQDIEGIDFTDIFENLLEKRNLKIIAVSSNYEYERYLAPNVRIRKFFNRVEVVPPSKNEALEIVFEAANRWESLSKLTIEYKAIKQMVDSSDQYITETPFPEKVIELLDAVVTYANQNGKQTIDISDVNEVLAEKTGISFASLSDTQKGKLENLEDLIHRRLVNQNAAVSLLAKTLRSKTVGIVKENRPIGSFLFLGPTGVGKTETAKVLANVYFGSEEEIIRFDMAEYAGTEGLERLIGSVARNTPGVLTTALKNKPASLLLLDEIEKANQAVYNLFLTLLDEGYITDAFGKQINCKNLFVVGTSNAGAEYIRQLVQNDVPKEELQRNVVNHILEQNIFSPEFINRFDGVVVYEPLSQDHLRGVARHMLDDLSNNLKTKNITLKYDDRVLDKLSHDGYDPAFGARPMRRIVNIEIGDMLGRAILTNHIKEGDTIELSANGEFTWHAI